LLVKEFLKIGEHLAKLQAKWLIESNAYSPYTYVLKDAELARQVK